MNIVTIETKQILMTSVGINSTGDAVDASQAAARRGGFLDFDDDDDF